MFTHSVHANYQTNAFSYQVAAPILYLAAHGLESPPAASHIDRLPWCPPVCPHVCLELILKLAVDIFFVHPLSLSLTDSTCHPVNKASLSKRGVNHSEWRVSVQGLCTDTVSRSDCVASNDNTISQSWVLEEAVVAWFEVIQRVFGNRRLNTGEWVALWLAVQPRCRPLYGE
jgi:hypothetical protein